MGTRNAWFPERSFISRGPIPLSRSAIETDRPDYEYSEGVTFHLYALEEGQEASAMIPTLAGETALTVTATRTRSQISFTAQSTENAQNWQALLVGIENAASVEGGAMEATDGGLRITPTSGAERLTITLNG